MNYPCHVIEDLLLLYRNKECSTETRTLIEQHLSGCSDCNACYEALCASEKTDPDLEMQKAASFRSVRRKLHRKHLIAAAVSAGVLICGCLIAAVILKTSVQTVDYDDNLSVSMTDGALVGRLAGSRSSGFEIKRVIVQDGTQEIHYLFYTMEETVWDRAFTSEDVFSEYTLCYADRGADTVDYVYYYTGKYEDLESMDQTELQSIKDSAVLLWSKGKELCIME